MQPEGSAVLLCVPFTQAWWSQILIKLAMMRFMATELSVTYFLSGHFGNWDFRVQPESQISPDTDFEHKIMTKNYKIASFSIEMSIKIHRTRFWKSVFSLPWAQSLFTCREWNFDECVGDLSVTESRKANNVSAASAVFEFWLSISGSPFRKVCVHWEDRKTNFNKISKASNMNNSLLWDVLVR